MYVCISSNYCWVYFIASAFQYSPNKEYVGQTLTLNYLNGNLRRCAYDIAVN